jgi:hypothetical protein
MQIELSNAGDGTLQVWGQVIDLRKASFVPMVDELHTAGLIHDMTLDLGVDPTTREILELRVGQRRVAVPASAKTGGQSCRDVQPRLQELVGYAFDVEFRAVLQQVFGGPRGCTHLLTLLHLMASGLPPALDFEAGQGARQPGELIFRRSVFVDGHEPAEGRLHLAVQLMDFHSAPLESAQTGLELLAAQHEARVLADVDLSNLQVLQMAAIERDRSYENLGEAVWRDEAKKVLGLVGRPIMPGFGKEVRRQLGGNPDSRQLRDALVQIAPGFVQCTPALADRVIQRAARARASSTPAEQVGAAMPSFMASGGGVNACYMWREDSPLLQIQPSARQRGAKAPEGS